MSVVVYDGKAIAIDRAGVQGDLLYPVKKYTVHSKKILTGVGPAATIAAMTRWYQSGCDPEDFPLRQLSRSTMCEFIVASASGLVHYEAGVDPIDHGYASCAFGAGRDFAYGALAMGADARRAVEVAASFSTSCGHGVDVFTLNDGAQYGEP